jgi:hypothetical protein
MDTGAVKEKAAEISIVTRTMTRGSPLAFRPP